MDVEIVHIRKYLLRIQVNIHFGPPTTPFLAIFTQIRNIQVKKNEQYTYYSTPNNACIHDMNIFQDRMWKSFRGVMHGMIRYAFGVNMR